MFPILVILISEPPPSSGGNVETQAWQPSEKDLAIAKAKFEVEEAAEVRDLEREKRVQLLLQLAKSEKPSEPASGSARLPDEKPAPRLPYQRFLCLVDVFIVFRMFSFAELRFQPRKLLSSRGTSNLGSRRESEPNRLTMRRRIMNQKM